MREEIVGIAEQAIKFCDRVVLAVRATGGWKYRDALPGSNQDKNKLCITATTLVYEAFLRLEILEDMLKHDSYMDRTIELYESRFREVAEILNKRGEEKKYG
jgi:hypothetical protein